MKTKLIWVTVIIMTIIFSVLGFCFAADLICDPQAGVASYIVDIDGSETMADAQADGSLKLNIDYLPEGQHTFKAKAVSSEGWSSDWSDPLTALKPETPTNLRLAF